MGSRNLLDGHALFATEELGGDVVKGMSGSQRLEIGQKVTAVRTVLAKRY